MFRLPRGYQQETLTWEIILQLNLTVWTKTHLIITSLELIISDFMK